MSSRKKKKRGAKSRESTAASAAELQPSEAEANEPEADGDADDDAENSDADASEPGQDEAEVQPAVSEISELKPRRKKKPAQAEEAEPEAPPDEVATAEPEAEGEEEEEEGFADDTAKEAPKTRAQLKRVIESLIFVSDQVITAVQLGRIAKTKVAEVRETLAELTIDYEGRGIELVEVNGGYQFRSAAASAAYVRVLVASKPVRLTRAQLETLALIAYRQPITRPEVDDVRGVDSGSAIKVLLDRDLIKILGRKDDAGRPLLYGTTPYFLEFFGMNTMQELPTLREFTELSDEHRELFKAKTNDIGDPSAEAELPFSPLNEPEPAADGGDEPEALDDDEATAVSVPEPASEEPLEAAPELDRSAAEDAEDNAADAEAESDDLNPDAETSADTSEVEPQEDEVDLSNVSWDEPDEDLPADVAEDEEGKGA